MRWIERMALAALFGTGAAVAGEAYDRLLRLYDFPVRPERTELPVCFGHGCSTVRRIALSDADWRRVAAHLTPPAPSPAAEREQIRQAVAEMERIAGRLAGTFDDRAGDLSGFGNLNPQLDCIDESSNTTTYLTLFEQAGLLRWHEILPRAHRGYLFFGGWPHYSALIRERDQGSSWVVDSWFRDNGEPPDVMSLQTWKAGWSPDGFLF